MCARIRLRVYNYKLEYQRKGMKVVKLFRDYSFDKIGLYTDLRCPPVAVFICNHFHPSMASYSDVARLIPNIKTDHRHLGSSL